MVNDNLVYRRAISLFNSSDGCEAEMEDDFHHFRIRLRHDGEKITELQGDAIRFPWTTCGSGAPEQLSDLQGLAMRPLREQLSREQRYRQCTHLYDLVELAIGQILRGEERRLYVMAVYVAPDGTGARKAQLRRNKELLLDWEIDKGVITSPESLAGQKVSQMGAWAAQQDSMDEGTVEAIRVLQRAIHVSFGKAYSWKYAATADQMGLKPTCYTLGKDVAARAERVEDHARDYTDRPEAMLGGRLPEIQAQLEDG